MKMLKVFFTLGCLLVSHIAFAEAPAKQLAVVSAEYEPGAPGYYSIHTVKYQMFLDDPAHANTFLPCSSSSCDYGLYISYVRPSLSDATRYSCLSNGVMGTDDDYNCLTVRITNSSQVTYREANEKFMAKFGESGTVIQKWGLISHSNLKACVGTSSGWSTMNLFSCFDMPTIPVNCTVSAETLNLQHGTLTTGQLKDVNQPKTASEALSFRCSGGSGKVASVRITTPTPVIALTDGLNSRLSIQKNGVDIPFGQSESIPLGEDVVFNVVSTLSATGAVAGGSFSNSGYLIINYF